VAKATAGAAPWFARDRVRARNDRADRDRAAHLVFGRGQQMTAYLISLALTGLVAIVIAEGLS
jgi:hypothetical protein